MSMLAAGKEVDEVNDILSRLAPFIYRAGRLASTKATISGHGAARSIEGPLRELCQGF